MTVQTDPRLARLAVDTIRFLAADAVEKAQSGHPGTPMGTADLAWVLWSRFLRYDPADPLWPDRDRFVLSAGHACMLLYGMLHLAGYPLTLEDLESFRQWGSKTPGHPERGHTEGVEATTGPLGQGVGNAVGMALAGKMLAARVGDDLVRQRVFCLASDGDLMEGVSSEASSLAGHLRLGNLLVYYDDNRITIDGSTSITFDEDVGARYVAYGWHVQHIDGHDHEAIARATEAALAETARPSLVICRTHIAHGAPTKQDTAESHGAPLGAEEVAAAKRAAGWDPAAAFVVPEEVRAFFRERAGEGAAARRRWEERLQANREVWDALHVPVPPDILEKLLTTAPTKDDATRGHGAAVLQKAAELLPSLVGGAADLASSTKTVIKGSPRIEPGSYTGRNLAFGIREHGMGAICNGLAYHGTFRPFASTFLQFADYMRPALRLAALARVPVLYVFTHDAVFLGEDGPTHQPIEHVWALRLIPGMDVYRPADGYETAAAFGLALRRAEGPSSILLTRQKIPAVARSGGDLGDVARGAYRVAGEGTPDALIAATGSELHLAVAAREALAREGLNLHVVSVLCLELFQRQGADYRARLFPQGVPVATVEAGRTEPWRTLAGSAGLTIGIDTFGASAPAEVLAEKFGLTAGQVTARLREWLR
ncbi:MAG TPA: transketolase [Candidatus Polarisedimenticolaceae bacterium]|nr:transketolase [Candidatus Polarisedimenticolaceae bacterium]